MTNASTSTTPGFTELGVPELLTKALQGLGITSPFPIQAATLPDSLAGRDVLGRGRTGSGKTIAFSLPLVSDLMASGQRARSTRPRALVLLPTRELATQVHAVVQPLCEAAGLTSTTVFGGVGQGPQVKALARGIDILIACPGRLEDLMRQGHVRLDDVAITVLDEADHMADLGFLPVVRRILDATPRDAQRLLFSATLDNGVDVLVKRFLTNPVTHSVETPQAEPDMEHHVLTVSATEKADVVRDLASGMGRSVLFTRTKHSARKLARDLTNAGVPAVDLHGNLSQGARDRNLGQFRDGSVRVLVATDVAARGIHVDDVALVVHVDPPAEHKAYLHRSGRTARAGASGIVVTVQTHAQRHEVADLTRKAGVRPTHSQVSAGSSVVLGLTGPHAPHVQPTAAAIAAATTSSRGNGQGRGGQGRGAQGGNAQGRGAQRSDRSTSSRSGATRGDSARTSTSTTGATSQSRGRSGAASAPARTRSAADFSAGVRRGR